MKALKYRYELKHVISEGDALITGRRLSGILPRDQSAGSDGQYHIRSLYFDTPEDRALYDKIDGIPIKEKFRIRFYNHDPDFIRLEKKIKHFNHGFKEKARLQKEEVQWILHGDTSFLANSEQALLRHFYVKLRTERLAPKTVVDYRREAYYFPPGNVRVTIDRDIRASVTSLDIFDNDLPSVPVLDGRCVLEVKYDEFLPDFIQDLIQLNKCTSAALSKYAACRAYM
ncbi:MAG: polyphosphate polymerase domain-containing protein [Syntrophomonadaceae bacterium]|nr:polyphosphate polymerase domain-containing protein [Syntrophomonadaceae bacterium]